MGYRLRYNPKDFKVTGLFKEGVTIVDVGAGNGVIAKKLVEAYGKDNVYAVEPNPKYLSVLTDILERHFEKVYVKTMVHILDESGREMGIYDKAELLGPKK